MNTIELMRERLASLQPEALEIADESASHAGHGGGEHYNLIIVSQQFAGKLSISRHRMIYNSLGDLMNTRIHALSIQAYAPGEL